MGRADLSFNILLAFWFRPAWASSEIWFPCISTGRALQHEDHFLGVLVIHCSPLVVVAIRVLGFLSFICKLVIKPRSVSDNPLGLTFPLSCFLFALLSSINSNFPSVFCYVRCLTSLSRVKDKVFPFLWKCYCYSHVVASGTIKNRF